MTQHPAFEFRDGDLLAWRNKRRSLDTLRRLGRIERVLRADDWEFCDASWPCVSSDVSFLRGVEGITFTWSACSLLFSSTDREGDGEDVDGKPSEGDVARINMEACRACRKRVAVLLREGADLPAGGIWERRADWIVEERCLPTEDFSVVSSFVDVSDRSSDRKKVVRTRP